ncbi:MAG: ATP-binding protein [Jaaginema sp. PMC 1079.18]|nr:ATP-binding protein [Jaaginema sp. PMC 1080.18]MEC4852914.1 ATP-binding protein [Jaaginema sp. PMC 1079.18]MEC4868789.1 ATP-binding protein [Jaaginema sp. PMC 1078.18]
MIAIIKRDRIMDVETIEMLVELAERLVYIHRNRHLSHLEKAVLQGALQGKRYSELVDCPDSPLYYYDEDYISRYIAYNLWKLLTATLRVLTIVSDKEKINKRNVREYLQRALETAQYWPVDLPRIQGLPESSLSPYWVERQPLITHCQDRLKEDIRVLGLVGIAGVGKTALAVRLAGDRALRQQFPQVYWLSCGDLTAWFESLVGTLLDRELLGLYSTTYLIDALLEQMRSQPCLLILDQFEATMTVTSSHRVSCREAEIQQFFQAFLTTAVMPSRAIVTSRLDLRHIACDRNWLHLQIQEVLGFREAEARQFWKNWQLTSSETHLERIAWAYRYHPLALNAIASEIQQAPYYGNLTAYWSDYGTEIAAAEQWYHHPSTTQPPRLDSYSLRLANLVQPSLEATFAQIQQTYPLATTLLGLGAKIPQGCDRTTWLSLLGDRSPDEVLFAFQTLQRYCVLQQVPQGDRWLYRVHPLMVNIAIAP